MAYELTLDIVDVGEVSQDIVQGYRAQRKANVRNVSASDADKQQTEAGQKTPILGAREREEKEKREETPLPPAGGVKRFEDFWSAWPANERKQDKVKCAQKWRRVGLDRMADEILADIAVKRQTQKWQDGYVEAPLVYLNGKRWEDGVTPGFSESGQSNALAGAI